jgi:hypothetical protein
MTKTVARSAVSREALQLRPLPFDEPLPLDEILDRVAADGLLREDAHRDPVARHVLGERDSAVGVLSKRADRRVDTAQPYPYEPHSCASRSNPGYASRPRSRRLKCKRP